jgi:hypothetical protein
MKVPQKTKNRISTWSSYTTSGYISRSVSYLNTHVYYSTIHNSQTMESAYIPIVRWTVTKNAIYVHIGVLFRHKEERNFVIWWKMDGIKDHIQWNKSLLQRQILHVFCRLWKLKEKSRTKTIQKKTIMKVKVGLPGR